MPGERWLIIGGPRCGKSTLARKLRERGIPTLCTDPLALVKEPEADVEYLPNMYASPQLWSAASQYVADNYLTREGPWCVEGVAAVRALRKYLLPSCVFPADRVVVLTEQFPPLKHGHQAMNTGVRTVWQQIAGQVPRSALLSHAEALALLGAA